MTNKPYKKAFALAAACLLLACIVPVAHGRAQQPPAPPKTLHPSTAGGLYEKCIAAEEISNRLSSGEKGKIPDMAKKLNFSTSCMRLIEGFVVGYEAAMDEHEEHPPSWCLPEDIRWINLALKYTAWFRQHQDAKYKHEGEALMEMLKAEYPCKD